MTQVFLVERSIELSNLIYVGLEQIEVQFFEDILVENGTYLNKPNIYYLT